MNSWTLEDYMKSLQIALQVLYISPKERIYPVALKSTMCPTEDLKAKGARIEDHYGSPTRRKLVAYMHSVVSFSSGKGGVGKTNIVANTAIALAKMGRRPLIFDADLGLANIDVLLGLAPKYNIKHVLSGDCGMKEIIVKGPNGILILPASSGVPELLDLTEAQKRLLLDEMDSLGETIDTLLIDTAAGISDTVLYFNVASFHRIVVVTPEPTSITDAYALIKVLHSRHKVDSFCILVNMASSEQEAKKVYSQLAQVADRFLGPLRMIYLGFIPKDHNLQKAVLQQRAVLDMYPEAPSSVAFLRLAQRLAELDRDTRADGNIKFFWRDFLEMH